MARYFKCKQARQKADHCSQKKRKGEKGTAGKKNSKIEKPVEVGHFLILDPRPFAFLTAQKRRALGSRMVTFSQNFDFCVCPSLEIDDETKPGIARLQISDQKRFPTPRVLPGFFIIASNWLLHMAVLSCAVIGRVDFLKPNTRYKK